ncbi:MAG: Sua5/YciO/YrdC/YwlC family protein [Proteobacteria bacterium]|nr:Sua5/YciO/YrdC/YwlC family protein [Pseudomonadota bacterium]
MNTQIFRMDDLLGLADMLDKDAVIAYPVEGMFGLGCSPYSTKALTRLRQLKARNADDGFIVVSDCVEKFAPWLDIRYLSDPRLASPSKVPTTWLAPVDDDARELLCGTDNMTLAVRVSSHEPVRQLCHHLASALVSTSANPPGLKPATSCAEVLEYFSGQIDAILDEPIGTAVGSSRIVDILTNREIRPYGQSPSGR